MSYKNSYIDTLMKIALKDYPTMESFPYQRFVDSIVRMPGPAERVRKFPFTSIMPSEASKEQAKASLRASGGRVSNIPTFQIEGIN